MELDTKASLGKTRKRASVFTNGRMVECLKDGGTKVSSTVLVLTTNPLRDQKGMVFGSTVSE